MAAIDIMEPTGGEQYAFYVATPERFWKFAAASLFDMQDWIRTMRDERRRLLVRVGFFFLLLLLILLSPLMNEVLNDSDFCLFGVAQSSSSFQRTVGCRYPD